MRNDIKLLGCDACGMMQTNDCLRCDIGVLRKDVKFEWLHEPVDNESWSTNHAEDS